MPSESLSTLTNRAAFLMRDDVGHRRSRRQQEQLQPTILEESGYPASYACGAQDSEVTEIDTTTTKTLQFHFDYEFVMKDPREDLIEVFYEDLPVLEYGILLMAVQAIGLDTCNLDNQNIIQWRPAGTDAKNKANGGNLQGTTSMIKESHVVSLSSSRTDVLDPTVESCEYLVDIAEDMICLPMRGKMMARYTGDDKQAVENYLLYHIRTEMDSQSVLVRQIHEILFLGDRATYGLQELEPIASDSYTGLAVGLSLSAGLLTLALYAVITRRFRRRKEESGDVGNVSKDGIMDIPNCISGNTRSSDDKDNSSLNSQDAEVPSTEQESMDLIMDDISDCPSDSPALHPQDLALNTKMVDMLPPLAPNQSTKPRSQTMQKRRRRKKKVKRKLIRTNSRESINEMATITEANEEVLSSDDDDTGSEYYSTDDEDSVDRPSRDPSPARSRTGSMGSVASGGSGGVPSPIKEEPAQPNTPRLPPPYV